VIDQFLTFAPEIPGWQFHGRRQRKDWATAFAYLEAAFGVAAQDARFTVELIEEGLSVTMYSSAYNRIEPIFRETFIFFLLSHSLGEEVLFDRICEAILAPPSTNLATLGPEEFSAAIMSYPPLIRW